MKIIKHNLQLDKKVLFVLNLAAKVKNNCSIRLRICGCVNLKISGCVFPRCSGLYGVLLICRRIDWEAAMVPGVRGYTATAVAWWKLHSTNKRVEGAEYIHRQIHLQIPISLPSDEPPHTSIYYIIPPIIRITRYQLHLLEKPNGYLQSCTTHIVQVEHRVPPSLRPADACLN